MSNQQINQYQNEQITPNNEDWYDIDAYNGGVPLSKKIKFSTIKSAIILASPNIYKSDGTLTDERRLNHDGNELFHEGGKTPRVLGFGETDENTQGNANYDALVFNNLDTKNRVI